MFGERLKAARKMAGLSLPQLSKRLGDVSKQSLSNYENGKRKPDSKILLRLSKELSVKPDFFFRDNNVQLQNFEYRRKAALGIRDREMIEEKSKEQLESYIELESFLDISPKFINPVKSSQICSFEDAEIASQILRAKWNLGSGPIKNLIETLESKEIKILLIDAKNEFDGLAGYYDTIPLIVINNIISDLVRKRMTVAHELGHLLLSLHNNITPKDKESYCFRFGGAFLIPREMMFKELGENRSQLTLNELIHLKEEYGISIQGLARRAKELNIITPSYYKSFCIWINRNGMKKNEPGNYKGDEKPIRKSNFIFRAISEDIISISKAASLSNKTVEELMKEMQVVA